MYLDPSVSIPVSVHTGGGGPEGTYGRHPRARLSLSDPFLIQDVLVKDPKLRIRSQGIKGKGVQKFASEQEEREFWEANDSRDYVNWDEAEIVSLPNQKLSTETNSLRWKERRQD